MSLKKHLAKKYIPASIKWKLVLKGVGKLYRAIYDEMEKDNDDSSIKALATAAYRVGLDFGESLKEEFQLGNTIDDIMFAIGMEHKIFGMKALVAEKTDRKVGYHCYKCSWQKYFTPRLCIAIGQAEKGVAHALNSKAKYHVLQTRTMVKDRCIFEIEIYWIKEINDWQFRFLKVGNHVIAFLYTLGNKGLQLGEMLGKLLLRYLVWMLYGIFHGLVLCL